MERLDHCTHPIVHPLIAGDNQSRRWMVDEKTRGSEEHAGHEWVRLGLCQ